MHIVAVVDLLYLCMRNIATELQLLLFCFCWYFGLLLSLNGLLAFLAMLLCSNSVGYEKRQPT